ncbi:restriction endonuclease subunit S [Roseivirga echinicomitans]
MQTTEKQNTPALRFPDFQGEWSQKKIGEICDVKTGNKDTQNKVENGLYPFFVRSNTIESINTFSYDGEAILTSGDGVGVGKNFHYINGKFDFHQRVYSLRNFNTNYSGRFIYNVFSERFYKRVMKLSAKNSVDSVRMDMISNMKIHFPLLPEQQKIASFLTEVDNKLQGLKRKKELLEQYKKGIMQKLFSQELRFKPARPSGGDENGQPYPNWEKKKLGEVAKFSKGKGISKNDISEKGSTECIRYGELYTKYAETISIVSSKTNVKIKELVLSKANDVIIPASGETQIDIATASCVLREGIALGGDLNIIRSNYNGVFLSYYLNSAKKLDIARLSQGISVVHIYSSQLAQLNVEFPSLVEQTKIANFLTAIDQKIEQVSRQIAKAETWKKGLLQKMFV